VQSRLDRLELLLEKAVAGKPVKSVDVQEIGRMMAEKHDREKAPDAQMSPSNSNSSAGGVASDNHDGTLLLDDGQSQFVSSLHYALLADEVSYRSCFGKSRLIAFTHLALVRRYRADSFG
jgi:hypothetical protein